MRKLFYLSILLLMMTGSAVHADDKENVFKTFPGLAEFYKKHQSSESITILACPPGVAKKDFASNTTPCGPTGTPTVPIGGGTPVSPCSAAGACGPGVGFEGGLEKPSLELWRMDAVPSQ
ncbi:hypothetical protein NBH19_08160 [Rhizobium sp. S95]|uniref:Uncharacterized protein n=1 Tax=Ciceribacter sichuanensis TaxID=2949647 RepID=A0AAJ1C163_9HYPH|nr:MULTISPECIES: hypothetical protein [unclassified Ciceribacter]MCM2396052.1 hypothetical protein [Ciceribacter sp. S95]MCO5959909.1 hypothetical protein [Ciceribacter sp. S101]